MPFDVKAFSATKFEPRIETVEVDELKEFCKGDGPLEFKVRGLTGEELYRVRGAVDNNNNLAAVLEGLTSIVGKEKAAALRDYCGAGGKTPDEHVRRLEMLVIACVDPKIERPLAVKLAAAYPLVFNRLTDKILYLTGMGSEVGKSKGSGKTNASETH